MFLFNNLPIRDSSHWFFSWVLCSS